MQTSKQVAIGKQQQQQQQLKRANKSQRKVYQHNNNNNTNNNNNNNNNSNRLNNYKYPGCYSNKAQAFLSRGAQVIVRMRGLPFSCSARQVVDFFATNLAPSTAPATGATGGSSRHQRDSLRPCEVLGGEEGVLFVKNHEEKPTGDAFVLFSSEEGASRALAKHKQNIGARYVELFRSSISEVQQVLSISSSSNKTTYELVQPTLVNAELSTDKTRPSVSTSWSPASSNRTVAVAGVTYAQAATSKLMSQSTSTTPSWSINGDQQLEQDKVSEQVNVEKQPDSSSGEATSVSPTSCAGESSCSSSSAFDNNSLNSVEPEVDTSSEELQQSSSPEVCEQVSGNDESSAKSDSLLHASTAQSPANQDFSVNASPNQSPTSSSTPSSACSQHSSAGTSYKSSLGAASQQRNQQQRHSLNGYHQARHHHHHQHLQQQHHQHHLYAGYHHQHQYQPHQQASHHHHHYRANQQLTHLSYHQHHLAAYAPFHPAALYSAGPASYPPLVAAGPPLPAPPAPPTMLNGAPATAQNHELQGAPVATSQAVSPASCSHKRDCVRLRGLPFDAQVEDVLYFLGERSKSILYQGVHMVYSAQGQPSGEAIVQMCSAQVAQETAHQFHKKVMCVGKKQRYIEVIPCSIDDLALMLGLPFLQGSPNPIHHPPLPAAHSAQHPSFHHQSAASYQFPPAPLLSSHASSPLEKPIETGVTNEGSSSDCKQPLTPAAVEQLEVSTSASAPTTTTTTTTTSPTTVTSASSSPSTDEPVTGSGSKYQQQQQQPLAPSMHPLHQAAAYYPVLYYYPHPHAHPQQLLASPAAYH